MKGTPAAPESTTGKAQVASWLNKPFAYAIASVQRMTNGEFASALPKLGPDTNEGDIVYLRVSRS